jgi:hypothetical protein
MHDVLHRAVYACDHNPSQLTVSNCPAGCAKQKQAVQGKFFVFVSAKTKNHRLTSA